MIRHVLACILTLLAATASASAIPEPTFSQRADAAIARWRSSGAAETWRHGYVPVGDTTAMSPRTAKALEDELTWRLRAGNPRGPAYGEIRWDDGSSLRVPLLTAGYVVTELAQSAPRPICGPPECDIYEVTRAHMTTMRVETNRGPATVPAWRLWVKGVPGTVYQAAVDEERIAVSRDAMPFRSYRPGPGSTLTFEVTHGSCDSVRRIFVREESDVVVVGAEVRMSAPDTMCDMMLRIDTRTVTLKAPLGSRAVINADAAIP
ncbi:hypothetical protein [Nonomuraea sediminis]|uniref:hypothetical protein n=1 Tax=Nonomuraea sediminis TaxID=2835864 RepID=UPI001BDC6921|nr:hypothetical protein [Nonomuraea sediminis]